MGLAVVYNPCSWCPYKEDRERCGMCELTFKRKKRISAEEEVPDFSNDTLDYFMKSLGYRKQSEWISVDERLPDPNEDCLVAAKVGDRTVVDLGERVESFNIRTGEHYCEWMIANDWDEGEGCEITHWMPIPEPPKMKGGAE